MEMQSLLDALREILGEPTFYDSLTQTVDYGLLFEYVFAGILLLVVVSCVFKLLFRFFGDSK